MSTHSPHVKTPGHPKFSHAPSGGLARSDRSGGALWPDWGCALGGVAWAGVQDVPSGQCGAAGGPWARLLAGGPLRGLRCGARLWGASRNSLRARWALRSDKRNGSEVEVRWRAPAPQSVRLAPDEVAPPTAHLPHPTSGWVGERVVEQQNAASSAARPHGEHHKEPRMGQHPSPHRPHPSLGPPANRDGAPHTHHKNKHQIGL